MEREESYYDFSDWELLEDLEIPNPVESWYDEYEDTRN